MPRRLSTIFATGYSGYTGSRGLTGFTGSVGPQGNTGSQGAIGYTGSRGTTGITGAAGTTGFTGSAGGFTTGSNAQVNSLGVGTAASAAAGEIRATGDITAYYSDDRLKTKLGYIENPIEKLNQISGFYYEANDIAIALGYEKKREIGVSAQEIQSVLPEIVVQAPIDEKYLTVKYEKLAPFFIEVLKEQQTQINDLKKEMNILKNKE